MMKSQLATLLVLAMCVLKANCWFGPGFGPWGMGGLWRMRMMMNPWMMGGVGLWGKRDVDSQVGAPEWPKKSIAWISGGRIVNDKPTQVMGLFEFVQPTEGSVITASFNFTAEDNTDVSSYAVSLHRYGISLNSMDMNQRCGSTGEVWSPKGLNTDSFTFRFTPVLGSFNKTITGLPATLFGKDFSIFGRSIVLTWEGQRVACGDIVYSKLL